MDKDHGAKYGAIETESAGGTSINGINQSQREDFGTLLPYRNRQGRLISLASLLIPFGTMLFFIFYCVGTGGKYSLDTLVERTTIQQITLIIHGVYFLPLPFVFDLGLDLPFPKILGFGKVSKNADNMYWLMSGMTADLFFCFAMITLLIASQEYVQRWTLLLPMAQCVYNLKNDLMWAWLGHKFSPTFERVNFMIGDTIVIAYCFIVYVVHFFTSETM